jgi:hypothetical protein
MKDVDMEKNMGENSKIIIVSTVSKFMKPLGFAVLNCRT